MKAILFDLDGTLIDTTPDMGFVLNDMLQAEDLPTVTLNEVRPVISDGVKGLLKLGFGIEDHHKRFEELRETYLEQYREHLAVESCLFPGLAPILDWFDREYLLWGIVTNKPGWLTEPLVHQLHLTPHCIVSGDDLPVRKPDPEPLYHACHLLGIESEDAIYVGDAARDIEAGIRAGMQTVYVGYDSYCEEVAEMADFVAYTSEELWQLLQDMRTVDCDV